MTNSSQAVASSRRVVVDGKFFRSGTEKFHIKGVSYGPFEPNAQGEFFPSPEQTTRDLEQVRELGANVLHLYHVPPRWFLDLAAAHELKVLINIPWQTHQCFLETRASQDEIKATVRHAVTACKGHGAVFAYSVGNEIPAEIVRWSGPGAVAAFIDELIEEAKSIDPDCLCTYISFPPTEFLRPQNIDFVCFNVYLHERAAFEAYMARLQMLADTKPLVLGEFGIDSIREGEARKCEILSWQIEALFQAGLAGAVIYSFTDDWFFNNRRIEDWGFGLTTRARKQKESFWVVQQMFRKVPCFHPGPLPRVSMVVACYNGERTLKACLQSLQQLNYPDYEVILVDDGSTDSTVEIALQFPKIRLLRQPNSGLSAARNTGILAATGEIVAFTDADCRADEDWLHYLVTGLLSGEFAGIGGHNLLPPDDSWIAAAVMVSPGGPAHVMLTDRVAEHVPGCNMAFFKWALEDIGGFDPAFTKAGDDVDVCWRLQERGFKIGFSPAGFVWHYRRSTVAAYLKQQIGYGEAEGILGRKHPEYFNVLGGGVWRGRIYTPSRGGVLLRRPIIYHGAFGSGFFQKLYAPEPALPLMFCTSLEYYFFITLPLFAFAATFKFLLPVALTSIVLPLAVCIIAGLQADLPKKKRRLRSRPLIALLFFLQPIVRGWARYRSRLLSASAPDIPLPIEAERRSAPPETLLYWVQPPLSRYEFLKTFVTELEKRNCQCKLDSGWENHDLEIFAGRWTQLRLTTVTEEYEGNRVAFRCRLRSSWSLRARLAFAILLGLELIAIGLWAPTFVWLWMVLPLQIVLAWYLTQENEHIQRRVTALLDRIAGDLGLVKMATTVQSETSRAR